jgi:REP element-mobilizing transposase RayT/transposase-like protein
MARPLRIEFEGAIYHVSARGTARQAIFLDERDCEEFLKRLGRNVADYGIRLYLFCLMGNHFHLMLETPRPNLGRFMQSLETGYAVYFNRRHDRPGHLTQGRYKARLVDEDLYLLRLSRYVHLNPVFAGAAKDLPLRQRIDCLRAYRWSSYPSYIGRSTRLEYVDYGPVLADVASGSRSRPEVAYRQFVERGLVETDEDLQEVLKASPHGIGSESFCSWLDGRRAELLDQRNQKEDVAFRRTTVALKPGEIVAVLCRQLGVSPHDLSRRARGSMARPLAAHLLCKYAGLTQRQVAETLGLGTGAAVSIQLKNLREALARDRRLQETLAQAERHLEPLLDAAKAERRAGS